MEERLTKFLSLAGVASRRGADELVAAGRVAVNGAPPTGPGMRITENDRVTLDGRPVVVPCERKLYYILHKPRGYVTSNADPHATKLARSLVPATERLFAAGRLDKDSEGLLLFSNDGDLVHALTHPRFGTRKEYHVTTRTPLPPEAPRRLCEGIEDAGERLRALRVEELSPQKYRFVLNEGKNREIRRMVEAVGGVVARLKRVAMGGVRLGTLPVGACRTLTQEEIALLRKNLDTKQEKE